MKLAIIHQESSTGGWAYIYNLVKAMKEVEKDLEIAILANLTRSEEAKNEYLALIKDIGVKIIGVRLKSQYCFEYKNKSKIKWLNKIINKYRKKVYEKRNSIDKKISEFLQKQDIIFYSWPYGIMPFDINKKTYFIPHDFIYTHHFSCWGGYKKEAAYGIYNNHKKFLNFAIPIVSTDFIAKELKTTFPDYKGETNVVYLPSLSNLEDPDMNKKDEVLKKYGITGDYILSANNLAIHKNVGQITSAMYYVKQKYPNIKLILTGWSTEAYTSTITSPSYGNWLDINSSSPDVLGLGIVNKDDFSVILKNAKMVVTTSLCEAGSGSGLDAWSMGVPVVMSDIEPFRNQVEFLGTKAEFCNPRNNEDVARAILKLLDNPELAREQGRISKKAMEKYTWKDAAKKYIEVFKRGMDESRNK